jgi:hypothetical protein
MVERAQRLSLPKRLGIAIWLLIGPLLCMWLIGAVGFNIRVTHNKSINSFAQTTPSGALAGIALFFLPYPLWQRVFAFVLYAPIAGVVTFLAVVSIACFFFHRCL